MGETGRQTLTPFSDVMLARYVAGDLHGDQLARVERAIGETPGLADRLERMRKERAAFLASNPPEQVAHSIVTRLTVERPQPSRWQVWWLLPPVSVATALLIGCCSLMQTSYRGLEDLFRPTLKEIGKFTDKPVLIVETGSEPGSMRARAVADLIKSVGRAKNIIGFVYFNARGSANWVIDHDEPALKVFRTHQDRAKFGFTVK